VSEVELDTPASGYDGPRCPATTTLRDALSLMLTEGAREVLVVSPDDGSPLGMLSIERVSDLLRERVTA
jgi:CBS domain-containing protein